MLPGLGSRAMGDFIAAIKSDTVQYLIILRFELQTRQFHNTTNSLLKKVNGNKLKVDICSLFMNCWGACPNN